MGKGSGTCDRPGLSLEGSASPGRAEPGCDRDLVLETVRSMPFERVYEVGGAIRDSLLGNPIKDVDIAVCGEDYEKVARVLRGYGMVKPLEVGGRLVGARVWGEWTGRAGIEFALARTEVSTGAGYHDFDIVPDPSIDIEQDLERRDFTVNAIARDVRSGQVFDPYGGVADCRDRRLRTVSPTSFRDDALRMLRGLVRISKDGLRPDDDLLAQMRAHAGALSPDAARKPVSGERVHEEMTKLLSGAHPLSALRVGRDTGALAAAIPEFAPVVGFDQESKYHALPLDEHIFLAVQRAAEWDMPTTVRFAALFHDLGKPASAWRGEDGRLHYYEHDEHRGHEQIGAEMAGEIWNRFGGDVASRRRVVALVDGHMYREDADCAARLAAGKRDKVERSARRWLVRHGDAADELAMLRRCDRAAKGTNLPAGWDADSSAWEAVVAGQRHQPLTRGSLALDGNALMRLGARGKTIGVVQRELLARVIDEPEHNRPEQLERWARALIAKA